MSYNFCIIEEECNNLLKRISTKKFKDSSILITGANGLIGGFLADFFNYANRYCDLNIKIFLTSYSPPEKAIRIEHLIHNKLIHYFSWDCSENLDLNHLPEKIDYCFFCSGYGQPSKFLKNNVKTSLINVLGPKSILDFMSNKGGNFLFLSTSELYGDADVIPTPEEYCGSYNLQNNRAAYKVSKSLGEVLCKEYNKSKNLNIKIARVALTYGPGALLSDKRVLQEFIFKANDGEIKMLDSGDSKRNYLYLTNSAELLIKIISQGKHMVYNVGGDTEQVTIFDLACKISKTIKCNIVKGDRNINKNKFAPKNVYLDMSRCREEFPEYIGYLVPIDVGIEKTIKWFTMEKK